jgi:hypothetical protein
MLAIAVFFGRRRDDLQRRRSALIHPGGGDAEFLAQMPTDTMVFLTMAVLGFAAMLIVLRWLI